MGNVSDSIGQRGEAVFYVILTRLFERSFPIFRPQFLGDKWPAVDFIVELTNYSGNITPYFFVQVKTTRQGYTKKHKRLKVKVNKDDVLKLASLPAPTYIVGIDENDELGYIISANGEHRISLTTLSTRYPINREIQDELWNEVVSFWKEVNLSDKISKFIDHDWR